MRVRGWLVVVSVVSSRRSRLGAGEIRSMTRRSIRTCSLLAGPIPSKTGDHAGACSESGSGERLLSPSGPCLAIASCTPGSVWGSPNNPNGIRNANGAKITNRACIYGASSLLWPLCKSTASVKKPLWPKTFEYRLNCIFSAGKSSHHRHLCGKAQ